MGLTCPYGGPCLIHSIVLPCRDLQPIEYSEQQCSYSHGAFKATQTPYGSERMLGISWSLNPYHKNSLMSLADTFPVPCGSAFCLAWQLFTSSSLITGASSGLNPLQWPARSLPLWWWSYIQVPVNKEVCFDNPTCLPTSVSGAGQLWSAPN